MAYREFAAIYDRLMNDMPYDEWVRFAERAWAEYGIHPRKVVDLGCGTGNIAIPLAVRGYELTGIDLSDEMLAVAQQKYERTRSGALSSAAGRISWLQLDMREWELDEAADAVVSFCDCLNYITEPEGVIAAFRRTYAGLSPGGIFAFDVHMPQQLEAYAASQPFVLDEDDVAYIWTCEYDEDRREIEHSITFFAMEPSGLFRRFEETHVQRAYPLDWLERELAAAGFTDIRITADFTSKSPGSDAERAFFTARKN